jgi:hypothetical protein
MALQNVKTSRKGRLIRWIMLLIVIGLGLYWTARWQAPDLLKAIGPAHEHCMKAAAGPFMLYADAISEMQLGTGLCRSGA